MINFVDEWEYALTGKITGKKPVLFVYAIEFIDKSVYVGITQSPRKRYSRHKSAPVNSKMREKINILDHEFKIVRKLYSKDDSIAENTVLMEYATRGYELLNINRISPTSHRPAYMGLK